MTEYVLSIDPGLSTGIALLSYDTNTPAELVQGWQFSGGVAGLMAWLTNHTYEYIEGCEVFSVLPSGPYIVPREGLILGTPSSEWALSVTVISEKFTARNTQGFSYTTASLEPLRCEGALIALGLMPDYTVAEKRWRDPSLQYFAGGTGKAERKKKQRLFLKTNGFYQTGKDFGTADADDFRSACAHGINYIARELKHRPTFDMIAAWGEEN